MGEPRYTVKALDASTWAAFAALVDCNNGVFGGCWCMGFHPEEITYLDAPQRHREQKLDCVRAGTAHAALVFDGDECVGWCPPSAFFVSRIPGGPPRRPAPLRRSSTMYPPVHERETPRVSSGPSSPIEQCASDRLVWAPRYPPSGYLDRPE